MTPTVIRRSADRKTIIQKVWDFYIVQSIATIGQCVERFDTLAEAEALFMEITLEDLK